LSADETRRNELSPDASHEGGTIMATPGGWTSTARRMWLWPVAIVVGFPIGGYVADLVVDGVDSVGAALAGGLITGAIIGAAEWFALRRRVS
jgi:hypothetical protein